MKNRRTNDRRPHVYLIFDKIKERPYYVGKHNGTIGTYITGSTYLLRYIRMFGLDAFWSRFDRIILEYNANALLDQREEFFIRKYNTLAEGGNRTAGGRWDVTVRKSRPKAVAQYDPTGAFVRLWESCREPYHAGVVGNLGAVSAAATGAQTTAGGYIWRFVDSSIGYPQKIKVEGRIHAKRYGSVLQMDKQGNVIQEFANMKEAAEKTGYAYTSLTIAVKGKYKTKDGTFHGYFWKQKEFTNINKVTNENRS